MNHYKEMTIEFHDAIELAILTRQYFAEEIGLRSEGILIYSRCDLTRIIKEIDNKSNKLIQPL
jgi:hypothetical protein